MKHLEFIRSRDDDYNVASLLNDYAAENKAKFMRGKHGTPGLMITNKCYEFDSWKIERATNKMERITICLEEV